MNSKARKICLLIGLLVILATLLTACQLNDTLDDKLEQYNLKAKITYNANGGSVNGNELTSADVYYREGDKAFNAGIGEKIDGTFSVIRENYTLIGWFYPQKNEDGSLKYNERTNLVELGDAFDFATYVAKAGDEIELYAKWAKNQSIKYVLASESLIGNKLVYTMDDKTITKLAYRQIQDDEDETAYEESYVIESEEFGIYTSIEERNDDPLDGEATNYSFVGYYSDAECKTPVKWPIARTDSGEDIIVYAKYLPSEWTVVSTKDEFASIFTRKNNSGKYYLKNDIDGGGRKVNIVADKTFSGVIMGNGFTASNFIFANTAISRIGSFALFGEIKSGAVIENITLKNISMSLAPSKNVSVTAYFLALDIANDATFTNVVLDGGTMTVNLGASNSKWLNRPIDSDVCPLYQGSDGTSIDGLTITNAPTLSVL